MGIGEQRSITSVSVQCAGCDTVSYAERIIMKNSRELSDKVSLIYSEVIFSFNSDQPILTAIWLRTLIEAICEKLIDDLFLSGVLSKKSS